MNDEIFEDSESESKSEPWAFVAVVALLCASVITCCGFATYVTMHIGR